MTIFTAPELDDRELEILRRIEMLREDLRHRVYEPRRWLGSLRRVSEGKAVQGSNSIEGYNASLDDVFAVQDGDEPLETTNETQLAIEGYQEAMTYVLQASKDSNLVIDDGILRALHFMMLKYDLGKNPGRWRPGPIWVQRSQDGENVYEGPAADQVPELVSSMLKQLRESDDPSLVRAAMAHLNLAMIHPFSDGNGRMARCLQTLVLAREQISAPVFSSIEEYLGRNTTAYYDVLARVGQGAWHPEHDARPWIRFCLVAHQRQAETVLRRLAAFEEMWTMVANLVAQRRLPERSVGPVAEAAYGIRLRRATYMRNVEVTWGQAIAELTASRDLKALVNAGLLIPLGDTRARRYVATDHMRAMWADIKSRYPRYVESDPFA